MKMIKAKVTASQKPDEDELRQSMSRWIESLTEHCWALHEVSKDMKSDIRNTNSKKRMKESLRKMKDELVYIKMYCGTLKDNLKGLS